MKFPSIRSLADSLIATLKRFPFEILFALTGTIAQTVHVELNEANDQFYIRLIMMANLGLLLSLAFSLYNRDKTAIKYLFMRLAVAVAGASLFFIFNPQLRTIDYMRFVLLSLAFHLFVSFAAFTRHGDIHEFWQFNKTLFLRFLTSVLYSAVLCLGLDAALAASNFLFNLHLDYKIYVILFTWIAGMFNTIFFLAGIPLDIAGLEKDTSYPKALKMFTQYVLIPLASVYVIILLAYELKILIQWNLPKGLVSNLILGYGVFGILSILLVYPLREQQENKWIKIYSRSFYFLLIPLIALLFLAIYSRVLPYGITPSRYFLIALAGWLLFITLYFLLSKSQNIKLIPMTLSVLALFSAYGPQSAFSVSGYSQRRIISDIFKKYGAYNNGKLYSFDKIKADSTDGFKAIDKIKYFVYDNDLRGLQPCITKDLNKLIDSIQAIEDTTARNSNYTSESQIDKKRAVIDEYEVKDKELEWMIKYLGLNKFDRSYSDTGVDYDFTSKNTQFLNTKGYDYVLSFYIPDVNLANATILKDDGITIKQTLSYDNVYVLYLNNDKVSFDGKSIADSLAKKEIQFAQYKNKGTSNDRNQIFILPNQLMRFEKQTAHFKIVFNIDHQMFHYLNGKTINITKMDGSYLIKALN